MKGIFLNNKTSKQMLTSFSNHHLPDSHKEKENNFCE